MVANVGLMEIRPDRLIYFKVVGHVMIFVDVRPDAERVVGLRLCIAD